VNFDWSIAPAEADRGGIRTTLDTLRSRENREGVDLKAHEDANNSLARSNKCCHLVLINTSKL